MRGGMAWQAADNVRLDAAYTEGRQIHRAQ